MQNAPSVDYPVGRFAWASCLALLFSTLSLMAFALGLWGGFFEVWRAAGFLVLWFLLSLYAAISWRYPLGQYWLCWDGQTWQVHTVHQYPIDPPVHDSYALSVHLDFQKSLLISLIKPNSLRQWFWISKSSFPERWHGFRCAVYSRSE
jgi:hypothetical protein